MQAWMDMDVLRDVRCVIDIDNTGEPRLVIGARTWSSLRQYSVHPPIPLSVIVLRIMEIYMLIKIRSGYRCVIHIRVCMSIFI
jgi:hypothetical protein